LSLSPRRIKQYYALAFSLEALGRDGEAIEAYQEVLAAAPRHPHSRQANVRLSRLLVAKGRRSQAQESLTEALQQWPHNAALHAELGTLLADLKRPEEALAHYEMALQNDPENVHAHSGIALILLKQGERERALEHGRWGRLGEVNASEYRGQGQPLSLLVVLSGQGGGVPIARFADDRVFQTWTLIPEFFEGGPLPPHDLIFNAIGDAELCQEALERAQQILAEAKVPVLNRPAAVLLTGRGCNAQRMGQIPNVLTARTAEFSREHLETAVASMRWPLLVRSVGFQLGEHFVKVDNLEGLRAELPALPGSRLLVMEFIDTRIADGKFRKYRAMMVNGKVYPLHVAVSDHWKVHYFSAQMDRPEYRAEDEAFLRDMPGVVGPARMQALRDIQEKLGLDYAGIDFGLHPNGELVLFEANAMMWFDRAGDEGQPYRVAPFERVRQAVRDMLVNKARGCGAHA
jgi:tetratricopeptide (TPR) repeat protein